MNYTDQQFNALAPYEDNLRTAVEGEWTRRIPVEGQILIRKTYEDATNSRIPFNVGCASCLINLLRRAGRLYFADKKEREANKEALAAAIVAEEERAAETEQKTLNVPGFENVLVHSGNVPVPIAEKPAKPAAKSAPAPQAKKPSSHHRNRQKGGKKA